MEKVTAVKEAGVLDRLWERGVAVLRGALYFLSGFILSGAGLFSLRVPLGAGLVAATCGASRLLAFAGAMLGCVLRLGSAELAANCASLTATFAVAAVLERADIRRKKRSVLAAATGILSFAGGAAAMFAGQADVWQLLLRLCSAALCGSSVIFFGGTNDCIVKRRNIYMLDNYSLICLTVSLCALLLGASEVSVMGFRPARLFGCFVVVTASFLFAQSGGCISGAAIGACVAVSGTGPALALCYGLCGLAAGIFSKYGQLVCALAFSLTAGAAALLDVTSEGLAVFAEAAAACVVFCAVPGKRLRRLRRNILEPRSVRMTGEFSGARDRLIEASKAIGSVSECINSVSEGIEALAPASDVLVCMRVRERVCSSCKLQGNFCPESGEFAAVLDKLAHGDAVSEADFSANFISKCPSVPRLADSFNRVYGSRSAVNALQADSARSRELACGQFDRMSRLLGEMANELEDGARVLYGKERSAARVLEDNGFTVISASCVRPMSGALRLSCTVAGIPSGTSLSRLTAEISRELEAEFMPPKLRELSAGTELLFLRKELYKIRLGSARASCGNQKLCGDYFEFFRTETKAYILLSDGMGTGGRAAIDSAMTVELFSRLIRAGISPDTALGITNSALSVKSEDESLSTLDVAEIDLFDGSARVLKAGAAPSFYTSGGRVRAIETPSTPLGILSKVKFSRYELKLRGGDTLLLVSDGVLGSGSDWIEDEVRAFGGNGSANDLAELILSSARRKCGEKYDDMTVIVAVAQEL